MQAQLGPEMPSFLEALDAIAPTSIHLNILKRFKLRENFDGVKWYKNGVYLPERPVFTLDPAFHAGAYYVQEASSMLIAEAAHQLTDLSAPLRVLDLCAAPGGKSILLASLLSPDSLLVSNEVISSRYQVLDYNLTKWGISNKITTSQEVNKFSGLEAFFDLILVDAPCSGEGLFRRDPEAVNEWSPENVVQCSIRQKKILQDTIALLKPGGILLYSTCTYNTEENDTNANWLLQQFPLEVAPLEIPPDWQLVQRDIGYQCYPHRVQGEGFYLAAFRKTGAQAEIRRSKNSPKLRYWENLPKAQLKLLESWLDPAQELQFLQSEKSGIVAFPQNLYEDLLLLSPYLRYFRMGTTVGHLKGKDLVPDPSLALSLLLHPDMPSVELDKENTLRFLKRESPELPAAPGWHLVRYEGLGLGWVKVLHNRANNYYPKEWMIRMSI